MAVGDRSQDSASACPDLLRAAGSSRDSAAVCDTPCSGRSRGSSAHCSARSRRSDAPEHLSAIDDRARAQRSGCARAHFSAWRLPTCGDIALSCGGSSPFLQLGLFLVDFGEKRDGFVGIPLDRAVVPVHPNELDLQAVRKIWIERQPVAPLGARDPERVQALLFVAVGDAARSDRRQMRGRFRALDLADALEVTYVAI